MANIASYIKSCRVSSVLNKDIKSYGKSHIWDGKDDTCWNSDKGLPQWINFELSDLVTISKFQIQFQGGFVGSHCEIQLKDDSEIVTEQFYPEDNNLLQTFSFNQTFKTLNINIKFLKSTDFFGRIIVYNVLFT